MLMRMKSGIPEPCNKNPSPIPQNKIISQSIKSKREQQMKNNLLDFRGQIKKSRDK